MCKGGGATTVFGQINTSDDAGGASYNNNNNNHVTITAVLEALRKVLSSLLQVCIHRVAEKKTTQTKS